MSAPNHEDSLYNRQDFEISGVSFTVPAVTGDLDAHSGSSISLTLPEIPKGTSYTTVQNEHPVLLTVSQITDGKITVTAARDWDPATENDPVTIYIGIDGGRNYYANRLSITIRPVFHKHIWETTVWGSKIEAKCTVEDTPCAYHDAGITLELKAETWPYNGKPVVAVHNDAITNFTRITGCTIDEVSYDHLNDLLFAPPVDPGEIVTFLYRASGIMN